MRKLIDQDAKPMEKLARQFARQDMFTLTGEEYAKPKGHADDLLGPWYNKRWIGFRCIRPYDAVSASRELLTFAEDGFRFMIPYYQYFDQIYRMADGKAARAGGARMKRRFAWLWVLLMLGAAPAETKTASTEPYTVGSYTVTPINEKSGTITDGTNTYSYRYSTSGSGYSVTFSYPDGERATWTENGSSGTGSASMSWICKLPERHGAERVFPGRTRTCRGKAGRGDLVLLFVGAFNAAWPTGAWARLEVPRRRAVRRGARMEPRKRRAGADRGGHF